MAKRAYRRDLRRQQLSVRKRIARLVRSLFSSGRGEPWPDPPAGGVGVREPRRPLRPTLSGTAVLEAPPEERRDVRAVGDDER